MAINPDEDTEFNDALRKHGILPPKPPPPPSPSPPPSPKLDDVLDDFTLDELQELADDTKDEETERMINAFRKQKLEEEKRMKSVRFGRVYPIGRDDYTREVTEASAIDEEGDDEHRGTPVICFLYKDGIPRSDRTSEFVRVLAQRHPSTKFVSIIGDKCIPNLPDSRLPMFIIYRKGEVVTQILSWGADREKSIDDLEALFLLAGAIELSPSRPKQTRGSDDSEDDEDNQSYSKWGAASRAMKPSAFKDRNSASNSSKKIRKKNDDSDSDFDFDL